MPQVPFSSSWVELIPHLLNSLQCNLLLKP